MNWFTPLKEKMEAAADPEAAPAMKKYMREQFEFLGIGRPKRHDIFRTHWKTQGQPDQDELEPLIRLMWEQPFREYQYLAQAVMDKMRTHYHAAHIDLIGDLLVTKSWWDTVDFLSSHSAADIFRLYPPLIKPTVEQWRHSENIWLVRAAILFQLRYKLETDWPLLQSLADQHGQSGEFFIQKGLGWALREYSKTDGASVRAFIQTTDLKPLTVREGLKWLNKTNRE